MALLTVQVRAQTLERLIFKHARGHVPGLVERVLDLNPGLAGLPDELPTGTTITVPTVTDAVRRPVTAPIRLTD